MSVKVVIVGGGPAGFSAAMTASKSGADVTVIERMDKLGGLGLVAGIASFGVTNPVLAEARALGGGHLYDVFESIAILKDANIPGVGEHAMLYNMSKLDSTMQKELKKQGVEILLSNSILYMKHIRFLLIKKQPHSAAFFFAWQRPTLAGVIPNYHRR